MEKNEGFTLMELLVALALSVVLGLALLTFVRQFQNWNSNLGLLMERDEQFRQAPLLLSRYLAAAGNNRFTQEDGLEPGRDRIRVRADLDGKDGFPDDKLNDAFEQVTLRQGEGDLQFQSGKGGFQPLLKSVDMFRPGEWAPPLLGVELGTRTARELRAVGGRAPRRAEIWLYLWNYRPNLFEAEP